MAFQDPLSSTQPLYDIWTLMIAFCFSKLAILYQQVLVRTWHLCDRQRRMNGTLHFRLTNMRHLQLLLIWFCVFQNLPFMLFSWKTVSRVGDDNYLCVSNRGCKDRYKKLYERYLRTLWWHKYIGKEDVEKGKNANQDGQFF